MTDLGLIKQLVRKEGGKIILLVLDGLGGLPTNDSALTALEMAHTPMMDRLASEGCLGLSHPIGPGITPGSGPAHLALFGYDPVNTPVGRGVLSALGIGFDLQTGDVAARGNFCTVDRAGHITDRRAGRIRSDLSFPLVEKLDKIVVKGVETFVRQVKEYRFTLVVRGKALSGDIDDTDPQTTGKKPQPVTPRHQGADRTASYVQEWVEKARETLKDDHPANMVTLRGFGQDPDLPKFPDVYALRSACVAVYPMYKGVSKLVGMDVLKTGAQLSPAEEFQIVADHWETYDFFFVHVKATDSRGEDGDQEAKAGVIEDVDGALSILMDLDPDVLLITGDHSTPAILKSHSWHPVPTLLWAPGTHLPDQASTFGERSAQGGGLGHFPAKSILPIILAHALRLEKYGA